jgi:hypothetical protein
VRHLECKKGDKGATPGLVVNGPRAGKVIWHKPQSNGAASREPQSSYQPAGERKPPAPKPLALRRLELAKRRKLHALKLVAEAIEMSVDIPSDKVLLVVAAIFGTDHKHDFRQWYQNPETIVAHAITDVVPAIKEEGHEGYRKVKTVWDLVALMLGLHENPDDNDKDPLGVARRLLWREVQKVLLTHLHANWSPLDETTMRKMTQAGETLVRLLLPKRSFAEFTTQAEKDLPEPKSWGNLDAAGNARGTIVSGKTAAAGDDTPERVAKKKRPKDNARKPQWAAAKKPPPKKGGRSKKGRRGAAGAAS